MDPADQRYLKEATDAVFTSMMNGTPLSVEDENIAMACADLMYKKNPGGSLDPLPGPLVVSARVNRFHSFLRIDTNNPFRDCLLQREMLERTPALTLIGIVQDLGMFPNVTHRLTQYEIRHRAESRIQPIFKAASLCYWACYAIRRHFTPDRIMNWETVRFLNAWMNLRFVKFGDTYAGRSAVIEGIFTPGLPGWEELVDGMFCTLHH